MLICNFSGPLDLIFPGGPDPRRVIPVLRAPAPRMRAMAVNSRLGITHLGRYVISARGGNLSVSISSAMAPAGSPLIYQVVRRVVMQPLTPLPSPGQRLARLVLSWCRGTRLWL